MDKEKLLQAVIMTGFNIQEHNVLTERIRAKGGKVVNHVQDATCLIVHETWLNRILNGRKTTKFRRATRWFEKYPEELAIITQRVAERILED